MREFRGAIVVTVVTVVVGTLAAFWPRSSPPPTPASASPAAPPSLAWRVVSREVSDTALKVLVRERISVSGTLTRDGIKQALADAFQKASDLSGFKFHLNPTHVLVWAYGSDESANAGGLDWLGMVEWHPKELGYASTIFMMI